MDFVRQLFGGGSSQKYAEKGPGKHVEAKKHYLRPAPAGGGDGEVRMLIMAIDYKKTKNPLTCSIDGHNMEALAKACNITDLAALYDEECSKAKVLEQIAALGGRCGENDYLVFYYSGHGMSVKDHDGDEADGKDEAFCFIDEEGQVTGKTLMRDDEFAEAVCAATPANARIVIMCDCCHSGTIADLDKDCWGTREVVSFSGCLDEQTSGDMGRGGICTHSVLLAIDHLQDAKTTDYSVGMLYNIAVDFDDKIFKSAQQITIQCNSTVTPDRLAWPLVPSEEYLAPLTKMAAAAGVKPDIPDAPAPPPGEESPEQPEQQPGGLDPEMLAQLGISPQLAQFMNTSQLSSITKMDPQELLKRGLEIYKGGSKACIVQ
mmetsp:Transcript_38637/g.109547  ORF Transcript_38637/g.109547 Transcript_38637/m.109547 type:complete len:375 (+) Transcript_38637:89-1213(+)